MANGALVLVQEKYLVIAAACRMPLMTNQNRQEVVFYVAVIAFKAYEQFLAQWYVEHAASVWPFL